MTEQEAIERLEKHREAGWSELTEEAIKTAITALKEIRQYREMEKRLKNIYGTHDNLLEVVEEGLEIYREPKRKSLKAIILTYDDVDWWNAYKSIGTVEECREAVYKQRARKPLKGGNTDKLQGDIYICVKCSKVVRIDDFGCIYCPDCGQRIDWSE